MTRAHEDSIGVDAYPGGWVAVALAEDASFVRAWPARTLELLLAEVGPRVPVGVDIPLGGVEAGWRHADLLAARELGSRRSTVFRMPPRPLWDLPYAEANAELKRLIKSGISKQAWNLLARVREAGAYRDAGAHQLMEVHPELVFAGLAGAVLPPKSSWAGLSRRRAVLADIGVVLPEDLGPAGVVAPDDILDAAAVAWCAYRFGRGAARHLPDPPDQYDERGRPIVIWH